MPQWAAVRAGRGVHVPFHGCGQKQPVSHLPFTMRLQLELHCAET